MPAAGAAEEGDGAGGGGAAGAAGAGAGAGAAGVAAFSSLLLQPASAASDAARTKVQKALRWIFMTTLSRSCFLLEIRRRGDSACGPACSGTGLNCYRFFCSRSSATSRRV
ncbi:hypothetical protein EGU54_12880 [Achromobacter aegrifaciens]|nr:hypothetical protein EGU54_12880 [Achromobacter aegrifaciens]